MHPCLTCGACCAMWRVEFEKEHVRPRGDTPRDLVVPVSDTHVCMAGTVGDNPRCVALEGVIGDRARCTIYPDRPYVCHHVVASWERGERDSSCDDARRKHGLKPLTVRDWR